MRLFLLVALALTFAIPAEGAEPATTRPFRMGFTGFVPALTMEALTSTGDFCRMHGALIAHHLEGAAWAEMHGGQVLPEALLKKWNDHRKRKPEGGKVYLTVQ